MFRKLLAYHDPELSLRFEKDVQDFELPLSDALSTMFMRTSCNQDSQKDTLRWFESLFLNHEPTPTFRHFMSLAVFHRCRDELLKSKFESLKTIYPPTNTKQLVHVARAFEMSTPLSCRRILDQDASSGVLDVTSGCKCLTVTAAEVLMSLGRHIDDTKSSSTSVLRYFVVDCRTRKRRNGQVGFGRLSRAFAIDSTWLGGTENDTAQLQSALKALKPMRGKVHICLVGASPSSKMLQGMKLRHQEIDSATSTIALLLLRHDFSYVSVIRGGFETVSKYLVQRKELADLVDFQPGPSSLSSSSSSSSSSSLATSTKQQSKTTTTIVPPTSAAAAQVMMQKKGTITLGAVVDEGPSEMEVRVQKTVASVKSWSIGIGKSAKSTWGNLRDRFKKKSAPSTTASNSSPIQNSSPSRLENTAGMFRSWIRDTTSSLSPPSFIMGGSSEKKKATKSKPKQRVVVSRPRLSSKERKEIALERHRLSGLRKGGTIQISDIVKMCQRKDPVLECEACKTFRVIKQRHIDDTLEPERVNRTLLVAAHRLLSLELDFDADMDTGTGSATVKSNHHLTELKKLSYTKKDPTLIKLYYKRLDETKKEMKINSYRIDNAKDFVNALTMRLRALKM